MVSERKLRLCLLFYVLRLGKPLKAGQVISCLVLPGANARSVAVTVNPEEVHTALVSILMFLYVCMAICLSQCNICLH